MPTPRQPLRTHGAPVSRRIALVLGGGGLKGFAHIGVLRALAERSIVPDIYAGTSIGALISAAHISGTSIWILFRSLSTGRSSSPVTRIGNAITSATMISCSPTQGRAPQ